MSEGNEKNPVQVIARAAAILKTLEGEASGLSLGEIAVRVHLPRSTVQRIIGALQAERFVIPASPTGRVRLGPAILRLSASVHADLLVTVHPHLVSLSRELEETVDYAIVRKNDLVFLDQVVSAHRLRTVSAVGESFPLHCTANGKAYLAQLDSEQLETLLGKRLQKYTRNTLSNFENLIADLRTARKNGFAVDNEEHTDGVSAIGVVLKDPADNDVAISVPVPTPRFKGREKFIIERLLRTKRNVVQDFATLD